MNIIFNPQSISANSRAAQYGDGCFTTMLLDGGVIQLWPLHLERLVQSCHSLGLTGFDPEELTARMEEWLSEMGSDAQSSSLEAGKKASVIKVAVSARAGGRGYLRSEQTGVEVVVTSHAFPEHYLAWRQTGISLGLSGVELSCNPQLAGMKHLNRLEQVLVKSGASASFDDVLVCDTDGMIVEASAANVFWRIANQWFTPDLSQSGVAGVQRKHIMNCMAKIGSKAQEVRIKPENLRQADEMFICNGVMGMVPVKSFTVSSSIDFPSSNSDTTNPNTACFTVRSEYFVQLVAEMERAR